MHSTRRGPLRRRSKGIGIAGLLAALALACGGDQQQPAATGDPQAAPGAEAPAAAPAKPAAPSGPPDAGAVARFEALYVWDPNAGETRDVSADTVYCMARVTAEGLPGVAEHIECMRGLGWKTLQPES